MKMPPRIVIDREGLVYVTDDYVVPGEGRIVPMSKIDITSQMRRALSALDEKRRIDIKKLRLEDNTLKIICLCGSTKFKEEFLEAQLDFTLAGHIVLSVGGFPHVQKNKSPEEYFGEAEKLMLDSLHKRKIDLADIVYIINKDGYVGKSTQSEFDYAMREGKIITFFDGVHGKQMVDEYASHGPNLEVETN